MTKLEASAAGHRALSESGSVPSSSVLELLPPTAETMAGKEATALEGEIAALRSRSWWQRLVG
jgi:hypothetical protein